MDKQKQKLYGSILVCAQIIIEEVDEIKENKTPILAEIQKELTKLQPKLEKLVDSAYNGEVNKTTFFFNLQKKIQYNLKKAYKL